MTTSERWYLYSYEWKHKWIATYLSKKLNIQMINSLEDDSSTYIIFYSPGIKRYPTNYYLIDLQDHIEYLDTNYEEIKNNAKAIKSLDLKENQLFNIPFSLNRPKLNKCDNELAVLGTSIPELLEKHQRFSYKKIRNLWTKESFNTLSTSKMVLITNYRNLELNEKLLLSLLASNNYIILTLDNELANKYECVNLLNYKNIHGDLNWYLTEMNKLTSNECSFELFDELINFNTINYVPCSTMNKNYKWKGFEQGDIKEIAMKEDGDKQTLVLNSYTPSELPPVSIVTITKNRRKLIPIVINSVMNQNYPKHLIEWVILNNGSEDISDLLPTRNIKVRYECIPEGEYTTGELRNKVVELASNEIICHMDDDDLYFKDSVFNRVSTLLTYKGEGIKCVGSTRIGCYHLLEKVGLTAGDGPNLFAEATMAYYKSFWEERKFNPKDSFIESLNFLYYRQDKCKSIPYIFLFIALTHGKNITGNLRYTRNQKTQIKTIELCDEEELMLIETMTKYLQERFVRVESGGKLGKKKKYSRLD